MLPVGTRSVVRAQGRPRALHCMFCCYKDAAQGIAETTWIPKARAVSRDYSPAAAQSYLEDSRLSVHGQHAVQSCKRNFTLTSSSQGLAEGSQERQLLALNLPPARRQSHQSDTFQQLMNKGKQEIKREDGGSSKAPSVSGTLVPREGSWLCEKPAVAVQHGGYPPAGLPGSAWPSFHDP